ncbi:carbohydrate ABC transporter permease [Paenibacillus hexagrammi]|uniref:Carbohydrate ABC transporter permease n=1 Tax=Paenibacillus hexagrammi TaxID=2908839 RepID=A0ABY3SDR3_9BACL|nr:carbohydrate ABC transporter permease [Paenibacillus sp. YPD9-1]UJF32133.1 carbohydrate ABC transporter permease [Paenibacillus sp. YPD9-1]
MQFHTKTERRHNRVLNTVALLITCAFLFPLYWMVVTSLKPEADIFLAHPSYFPEHIQWASYTSQLIGANNNILHSFVNSAIISVSTMVIATVLAIPAAYGLARFQTPWKKLFILLFLVTQMLPSSLILTPLFIEFKNLHILNTFWAPIFADATIGIPFSVMILRTYFISLPKELEDSAKIDGCNTFTTFLRIMLPIAIPGVVVAAVFSFLYAWGDLIYALTFISKPEMRPVTAGIYNFLGYQGISWNNIMAFGVVSVLPVILIFIFIQKYIVSGLTNGAVKG